jgi:hypothetical protein
MEAGQRRQREREEGQGSLFDALAGPSSTPDGAGAPVLPAVAEWPSEQLLAYEKGVLGFYLSGHPLERYRDTAQQLGTLSAAELATRSVGARVAVLGQISSVRERATKSGNRMAFATLEVVDGAVSLTVFPEALKTCGAALRAQGPVLVKARIDDTDKGRVLLVEEISVVDVGKSGGGGNGAPRNGGGNGSNGGGYDGRPGSAGGRDALAAGGSKDDSRPAPAHTCRIQVRPDAAAAGGLAGALDAVKAACQSHPGPTPLFVHVLLADREIVVKAAGSRVDPGPALVAEVERWLGPGSVIVEHAGRA